MNDNNMQTQKNKDGTILYAESNLRSNNKVDIRKIESGEYYRQARKDVTVKQFCKW